MLPSPRAEIFLAAAANSSQVFGGAAMPAFLKIASL